MRKPNLSFAFLIFNLSFLILPPANAQYAKLLNFSGVANGSNPAGDLFSDGTFLYGMANQGGTDDFGTVFKIKSDGTGFSKLLDFTGTNGSLPSGSFISDGTFLYGMTTEGGANDFGTVFKIKPDGTGYAKLMDFTGTNGSLPSGSLISDGTFLYGMTTEGGAGDFGSVFKIKSDGTGFAKLFDFSIINGIRPYGSLITDGTFLYGMTNQGGINNMGVIFKIKPDGTGFAKLLDFTGTANGSSPWGSLLTDGTFLYGMTSEGGANNIGDIFKIKPDGTGFAKLLDFTGAANGSNPFGSLISDGTFLYGMTNAGGANSMGTIFKIKPDGTGFSKLLDFAGAASGSEPSGSLISSGSILYGMTAWGGTNDSGTVFRYDISTGMAESVPGTGFSISPNPGSGEFLIKADDQQPSINTIEVYNAMGEKVTRLQLLLNGGKPEWFIDLSSRPNGIYFLQLKTTEGTANKKLIISR